MDQRTLMVCPHDAVRRQAGWQRLAGLIAARLQRPLRCVNLSGFAEFRQAMADADLVYASPGDALSLIDRHGFRALARPAETYDRALIVVGPDGPLPAIEAIHGSALASVEPLLPTRLALRALRARGIIPSSLQHHDSWLSVVRSVWNGEAPFGVLYRDAYDALSAEGRAMVRILAEPAERAFHLLAAHPNNSDDFTALSAILRDLPSSAKGSAVMAELGFPGWLAVSAADIADLRISVA